MVQRACSECGKPLGEDAHPRKRTCSKNCRKKRSLRIQRRKAELAEQRAEGSDVIAQHIGDHPEAINDAITKELQPLIRGAITEDTLRGISNLLGLLPEAVERIKDDLSHPNASVRQRAYTTLLKYTVGQQLLVGEAKDDTRQLHVNFNLPRPGDEQVVDAPPDAIDEVKECDTCHADKPIGDFVSGSDRCRECFNTLRDKVTSKYAD
jgi:hypothetical protein